MLRILTLRLQSLLYQDPIGLKPLQGACYRALQIFHAVCRDLADGQFSLRAMGLVYTTLITLVPLLAISFSVLKGFGVHNQIEPMLLNVLEGLGPEKSVEVTARIIDFVDNIDVGVLGAVGLGLLIYAVIALMQKIEASFNYIWRVGRDRGLAKRFSDYLSVLLMGPLLIFMSAGITTTLRHSPMISHIAEASSLAPLYEFGGLLVPWLVMAAGFTFVYVYLPNTKVRISAAFCGAMVAALLWKLMGYFFASFIAGSANYVAIYAAFATLIVFMIWLYASWLVVLIGCNVSFYVQYPRYLRFSRAPLIISPHMNMALGLSLMALIVRGYYAREAPWTAEALSKSLNIPMIATQNILDFLEKGGLLTVSKNDPPQYFPACPLDQTPLQKVIEALESQGQRTQLQDERMHLDQVATRLIAEMDNARTKHVTSQSIAQAFAAEK